MSNEKGADPVSPGGASNEPIASGLTSDSSHAATAGANTPSRPRVPAPECNTTKGARNVLSTARTYKIAGLSTFPVGRDKRPGGPLPRKDDGEPTWKPFTKRMPTEEELTRWHRNDRQGIGIVCGAISGNLEVLDFDAPGAFEEWEALMQVHGGGALLASLPHVRTPSGGHHIYYRCEEPVRGSTVLARLLSPISCNGKKTDVKIETRGEGGYAVGVGSPKHCHVSLRPYTLVSGDLTAIPTITATKRKLLISLATLCDEQRKVVDGPSLHVAKDRVPVDRLLPGQDFNQRGDVQTLLKKYGWSMVKIGAEGESYWRRPGKTEGTSATLGYKGSRAFKVFSTNALPFEGDRAYSPFSLYALLEHGGDYVAAASDLYGQGYGDRREETAVPARCTRTPFPILPQEALHGLAGDIVQTIAPLSEANPAALLFQYLICVGNAVGRVPHFYHEDNRHGTSDFTVIVAPTGEGKGTSLGRVQRILYDVDPTWRGRNLTSFPSGEAVPWAVRDPRPVKKNTAGRGKPAAYEAILEDGVDDKRLMIRYSEFAEILRVMRRDGNTLSPVLRAAWDGDILESNGKTSPCRASDPHVSFIGHITKMELQVELEPRELMNGLANRFLWVAARLSHLVEDGAPLPGTVRNEFVQRTRQVFDHAQSLSTPLVRDERAQAGWSAVYPLIRIRPETILGSVTGRAPAHVMRLAIIYAILDLSDAIRLDHLIAALAAWQYAEASAVYLFEHLERQTPEDQLLTFVQSKGPNGTTRTEIRDFFGRNKNEGEITSILSDLQEKGLVRMVRPESGPYGGRPPERWIFRKEGLVVLSSHLGKTDYASIARQATNP